LLAVSFMLVSRLAYPSTVEMESICSSETSVECQLTPRGISQKTDLFTVPLREGHIQLETMLWASVSSPEPCAQEIISQNCRSLVLGSHGDQLLTLIQLLGVYIVHMWAMLATFGSTRCLHHQG
jgi:hypothetical protein